MIDGMNHSRYLQAEGLWLVQKGGRKGGRGLKGLKQEAVVDELSE